MNELLLLNNVFYNDILEGVSLSVKRNEITTIIGPNGGGKTTLLKLIARIIKPSKGDARFHMPLKIGYMPQSIKFDRALPMNVYDFLTINKNIDKDYLQEKIDRSSIQDILKKQISSISGGELQKVLFVFAISIKPDLLILDEPINNLDLNARKEFYEVLEDEHQDNKCAVVMASHDIYLVMKKTNNVICLNKKICCQGHPEIIMLDKNFIDMFGENLSIYKHDHTDSKSC